VVLSGTRNRIKLVPTLFQKVFGEKIVFIVFKVYPETTTSSLMKKYALKLGIPENRIVTEISKGESNAQGKSITNLKLFKKLSIFNFTLVTSSYHTRRSKLIFQRTVNSLAGNFKFMAYPGPETLITIQGWWKLRTEQIGIFLESLKYISYHFF
jgi:uncharacterized SAM-binding protein YcdF (DUF218 family)